ncbi:EAL domain-containing protein [Arsenicicoccus piscis]|uniref:putative bifunctional diguanylate cyclase/phosphodiesterase n=1 Tax=Arsenicicoccus piscis TaxID=673954 RepID=UPI001F4D17EA|nr:EAL domain-containing protein [Arsenicicoccus piscis]MCH8626513.1 EAL domain-containing protein [Arsenicicoccus piscis]
MSGNRAYLPLTAGALSAALFALTVVRPELLSGALLLMSVLAGLACGAVALRADSPNQAPWALLGLGYLAAAAGYVTAGSTWPVVPGDVAQLLFAASALLVLTAIIGFATSDHEEWTAALLHGLLLTTIGWVAVWQFDPRHALTGRLRWQPSYEIVDTLGVVAGIVSVGVGLTLALRARQGGYRRVVIGIVWSAALSLIGTLAAYLPVDPAAWVRVSESGWLLSAITVLIVAAVATGLGETAPPVTVLDRHRDLVIVSVLIFVLLAALVLTARSSLDIATTYALTFLVGMLVCLHLVESSISRRLTEDLRRQERHMRLLVSETRDIIVELDRQGSVVFASEALRNILGRRLSDYLGQHVSTMIPDLSAGALSHLGYVPNAQVQPTLRVTSALATPQGAVVHAESVITPLSTGFLVAVRDVSERVGLQSRLQQVAYHDIPSGLANRARLDREVRNRLYEAASGEICLALLDLTTSNLVDEPISDETRDEVLRQVGRILRSEARTGDTVARFGDLRFAILFGQGTDASRTMAEAQRIVDAVNAPRLMADITLRAHAGVAVGSHTGLEVVRNAELALLQAQRKGTGAVVAFEPGMLQQFARTRDLRRRLARTPDADRWTVLYQPVIDLTSGAATGVEALLRWTDPEGDFFGIEEVIRLAEEFGSILAIGSWVMDQAVAQAAAWLEEGLPLSVAVNVSVRQLTAPDFADTVERVLADHALPAEYLVIEITETVVLEQTEQTISTLKALRSLGVRVAIDDFGTGYSGLANLRSLPLDILKIDRSFIQGLGESGGDEAVVAAVTRLGRELGLTITAEGIETRDQERRARALGITAAQGYLFARPIPAAEVTELIKARGEISSVRH